MERLSACPCVVRLHEAALTGPPGAPTAAYALMDYCPETLVGFLQQRGWRMEEEELLRVALSVARAVQAMHTLSPPLAHRCGGRVGNRGRAGAHGGSALSGRAARCLVVQQRCRLAAGVNVAMSDTELSPCRPCREHSAPPAPLTAGT